MRTTTVYRVSDVAVAERGKNSRERGRSRERAVITCDPHRSRTNGDVRGWMIDRDHGDDSGDVRVDLPGSICRSR